MLIPSIDLKGGKVVQLVQGARTVFEDSDVDAWVARFAAFPLVQLVDLDAALGTGQNDVLLERIVAALPCQVGGGIRTPERARRLVDAGARRVIAGSALFGPEGVRVEAAARIANAVGRDALIAAVDNRHGIVVTRGWTRESDVGVDDAVVTLAPHVGGFLCTFVETEGTMSGIDVAAAARLRALTDRPLIAAGGIRSAAEVEALDRLGIDAVVGMAVYTGAIALR